MYRFSSGLKYTGSTEKGMSYLIFQSESLNESQVDVEYWNYWGEKPAGTRMYKSKFYGRLKLFNKPLNEKAEKMLFEKLDKFKIKNYHPAFKSGFKNEAKRLFQDIDSNVEIQYNSFIDFLKVEFNLETKINKEVEFASYSDDIGPFMIGSIGDKNFIVPETPNLYLAPKDWRIITWYINNHLSGPYPKDKDHSNLESFHWNNLKLDDKFNSHYYEGIAYYLIANFILIYEAFSKRKSCDSLSLYIDLIQKQSLRPWKNLF